MFKKFLADRAGEKSVVGIAVTIILIAALVPVALNQFFGADTTTWDASSVALWALIPIFVIIALFMRYAKAGGGAT